MKEGKADMKNLSMNTMGGQVVMNGYYSTQNAEKPEINGAFKLTGIQFAQAYKESSTWCRRWRLYSRI